jgi:hypothetical protein
MKQTQIIHMNKKTLSAAFVLALLSSAAALFQLVSLAAANFDFIAPSVTIVEPEKQEIL